MSSSILNLPTCSPSPPHAHPVHHVSCALAIASYLGDLFALDLVNGSVVVLCLRVLVENMRTIEQLMAAHAIISHCDARLGLVHAFHDVIPTLQTNAAYIHPNGSPAGLAFDQGYPQLYVQVRALRAQ